MNATTEGIKHAVKGAPDWWKAAARDSLLAVAQRQASFTVHDVHDEMNRRDVPPAPTMSALGGIMIGAEKAGTIVKTDQIAPTRRPGRHADLVRVWHSQVYEGGE